jgi:transcription antitermination protein NusB
MSRRSRVRQVVLQLLFQDDLNPRSNMDWRGFLFRRLRGDQTAVDFGGSLLLGVRQHRSEIDQQITDATQNWKLNRISPVDRNIIRLAAFEFLYLGTPPQVAINEGIELAKRFGTANSSQFVNGILDRVLRTHRQQSAPTAAPVASGSPESERSGS